MPSWPVWRLAEHRLSNCKLRLDRIDKVHRTYQWDETKNRANLREHKIGLDEVRRFEWADAVDGIDGREDYRELRETAIGFIGDVLYYAVFTERGRVTRMISLRRASKPEVARYVRETNAR